MTIQDLEKVMGDKSVSDKEVFNAWLEFCERDMSQGGAYGLPEIMKLEADLERLRNATRKLRPKVWKMIAAHVIGGHYYCCGPGVGKKPSIFHKIFMKIYVCLFMLCDRWMARKESLQKHR